MTGGGRLVGAIGAGAIVTIGTIVATSAIGAIVANESPLSTFNIVVNGAIGSIGVIGSPNVPLTQNGDC